MDLVPAIVVPLQILNSKAITLARQKGMARLGLLAMSTQWKYLCIMMNTTFRYSLYPRRKSTPKIKFISLMQLYIKMLQPKDTVMVIQVLQVLNHLVRVIQIKVIKGCAQKLIIIRVKIVEVIKGVGIVASVVKPPM
jgi:hypothetical protein